MTVQEAADLMHERTHALMRGLLDVDELPSDGPLPLPGGVDEQRMLLMGLEVDDPDDLLNRIEGACHKTVHMVAMADSVPTMVNTVRMVFLQQVLFGYLLGEAAGYERGLAAGRRDAA